VYELSRSAPLYFNNTMAFPLVTVNRHVSIHRCHRAAVILFLQKARCFTSIRLPVVAPTAQQSAQSSAPGLVSRRYASSHLQTTKLITGIQDIIHDYDVYLLDMWGVLHDGSRPYEGVLNAIRNLKQAGKRLVILSNSSKRRDHSVQMLIKLGFDPFDFDQIITSGQVAHEFLSEDCSDAATPLAKFLCAAENNNKNIDRKVFVLGSGGDDDDQAYFESCGWTLAPVTEASLIVARGTFTMNDGTTVIDKIIQGEQVYNNALKERLEQAAERRLPMLISNPDKTRPDKERSPMPGQIGDEYKAALGGGDQACALIKHIGKPFGDVYDIALNGLSTTSKMRAIMVGDALETDVTGGAMQGIATLWILDTGIHGPDVHGRDGMQAATSIVHAFQQRNDTYANGMKLTPNYLLSSFQWSA
jgi:HAD superfamily hydrolase (TIGR01450 family)